MEGFFPYCAMMQVAAEDTLEDYVLCRGFDVRMSKFIDYEEGNADKPGIPCAKPYWNRRKGAYQIAQIYPAFLPLQTSNPSPVDVPWRVGQNPGYATVCPGHPCDLDETVDFLIDANGVFVNWMLIDGGVKLVELCAQEIASRNTPYDCLLGTWNPALDVYCYDDAPTVKAIDHRKGPPHAEVGWKGLYQPEKSDTYGTIYVNVSLDCALPPEGCTCE